MVFTNPMTDVPPEGARGNAIVSDSLQAGGTPVRRGTTFLLAVLAVAGMSFGLGSWPLLEPDEGRNAEVAREMASTNDYVLPHLNGLPYLDKPILYFAVDAATMEVLGVNELAARLPSLLFALATVAAVVWFGWRIFSPAAGVLAGFMFAASPLTIAFARIVIFDTALTLFIVFAIMAFFLAVESPAPARRWSALAWVSMALGILTKGPIALALPLLVALPYAIWRKRAGRLFTVAGVLLFAAIVAAWVGAVSLRIPGFLHYALVVETFKRLTTGELKRSGPIWYFVPYLLFGALPWSIAAIADWRRIARRTGGNLDPRIVFLLLWIVVPFVFFSLSQSKRPQYILPVVPAIVLLVAHLWSSGRERAAGLRSAAAALAVVGTVVCAAALTPALLRKVEPDLVEHARLTALALGAVCIAAAILAFLPRRSMWYYAAVLALPPLAISGLTLPLLQQIAEDRSAKSLVEAAPEAWERSRIVSIFTYYPSISFYARKTVTLVTTDANEFRSNYMRRYPDRFFSENPGEMRRASTFLFAPPSCSSPEIFVVKKQFADRRRELSAVLPTLAENDNAVAFGPCAAGGRR